MNKVLSTLLFMCIFSPAVFSQVNIIVKFKSDVDYTIDYSLGKVTCSNKEFAHLINQGGVQKITSFISPKSKARASLRKVELVKNIHFFQVSSSVDVDDFISRLQRTGLFEYVEKDHQASGSGVAGITPNDNYFFRQWSYVNNGTFNTSATANADVDMDEAWTITTGSSNTIVCILDTGLKLDHPEVAGRLWVNANEIPNNGIDDDANGYVDDVNGWDWVNTDNDPTDDYGHGTNVAGIVGATGNNVDGYAGVNWNCKLMTGKVLNSSNSGSYSWMMSGISYAVAEGANIINMSIGGSGFSQGLKDACDFAHANDVALFACMMNFNNNTPYYPAAYPSTIAIGATDVNDYRVSPFFWSATSGSNYGSHIDLVAPGNYIYGLSYNSNTNYGSYWGGTSQATPLVAGVASLIHALKPNVTVEELRTILRTTAVDLVGRAGEDTPGWDQYMGAGRMNAHNALQMTLNILPVKLSKLSGVIKNDNAILNWKTFEETGAKHFEIEHSPNAFEWKKISEVPAVGTASTPQTYTYTDKQLQQGTNYYRLKQVDADGHFQYSNVVKLLNEEKAVTIKASSPFSSTLHLTITATTDKLLNFFIYSSGGGLVKEMTKSFSTGTHSLDIDASAFSKGSYTIVVTTGNEKVASFILVKQ